MPEISKVTLPSGKREWVPTQTEAKKIARDSGGRWEAVEVSPKKPELLSFVQEVEAEAFAAGQVTRGVEDVAIPPPPPSVQPEPPRSLVAAPVLSDTTDLTDMVRQADADVVASVLEAALQRFGELGEPARDALDTRIFAFNAYGAGEPSSFFRRGAVMLTVMALGEIAGTKLPMKRRWGENRR